MHDDRQADGGPGGADRAVPNDLTAEQGAEDVRASAPYGPLTAKRGDTVQVTMGTDILIGRVSVVSSSGCEVRPLDRVAYPDPVFPAYRDMTRVTQVGGLEVTLKVGDWIEPIPPAPAEWSAGRVFAVNAGSIRAYVMAGLQVQEKLYLCAFLRTEVRRLEPAEGAMKFLEWEGATT